MLNGLNNDLPAELKTAMARTACDKAFACLKNPENICSEPETSRFADNFIWCGCEGNTCGLCKFRHHIGKEVICACPVRVLLARNPAAAPSP